MAIASVYVQYIVYMHLSYKYQLLFRLDCQTQFFKQNMQKHKCFLPVHHPRTPCQTSRCSHIQCSWKTSPSPVIMEKGWISLSLSLALPLSSSPPSLLPYSDDNGLIGVHVVHYEPWDQQLRTDTKADLLLDTPTSENPSANLLVSEINLQHKTWYNHYQVHVHTNVSASAIPVWM